MSETTGFEEIEKQLSNQQKAVLHLLIALENEVNTPRPDGNRVEVDWYNGMTVKDMLTMVKNGQTSVLPSPEGEDYVTFNWSVIGKRDWKGETEEYITGGTPDSRLIFDGDENALKIFANTGSYKSMEPDLERVLNRNSHRFIVEDRGGFRFENNAHKAKGNL